MGDEAGGLEAQKLQLEREKLAFEIRKFEADETRRQNEAAKLAEEVRELRRPWYRKSASLTPLATITVAVVGGLIAFGTDFFKSNVVALRSERDGLSATVKDLGSVKTQLTQENASLSGENERLRDAGSGLQKTVATLTNNATALRNENGRLQTEKQRLTREVGVTELKTHLKIVDSFGKSYNHLELGNQSLQSILAIADQFKREPTVLSVLRDAYDSTRSDEVKAALALALFEISQQSEWKDRLRQISTSKVLEALGSSQKRLELAPLYLALLRDDSVFKLDERVATLKEMYAVAKGETNATAFRVLGMREEPGSLGLIVDWDEDATIQFRDPWFEYLGYLYDLREWEGSGIANASFSSTLFGAPRLLSFAPQAFGILLVASLKDPFSFVGREIPTGILSMGETACPYFPADFPLCIGLLQATKLEDVSKQSSSVSTALDFARSSFRMGPAYSVTSETAAAAEKWVEANRDLISVWTDRTFSELRASRNEVMRQVIRRQWVNLADVGPPRHQ